MIYRQAPAGPSPILYAAFGKHVVALERSSGRRIWAHELRIGVTPRIVVEGARVYVLQYDLSCLDAATGALVWRVPGVNGGSLLVDGDCIFVGGAGVVACYATIDGRHLWEDTFKGFGTDAVALAIPGAGAPIDNSG